LKLLADECCDRALVRAPGAGGHDVLDVSEVAPGSVDGDVLTLAVARERVLLTEDRDFGELVFAGQVASDGVLYIRFPGNARETMLRLVPEFITEHGEASIGGFTVLTPGGARIRRR
jgi:predicted nuclease of predicted toxin-antitoxin system